MVVGSIPVAVTYRQWVLSISLNCLLELYRLIVHLLDRIDRNDALESSRYLTESLGEKIITRMNLQISIRKIYCETSNYKALHHKNIIKN